MKGAKLNKEKSKDGFRFYDGREVYEKRFMVAGTRYYVYGKTIKECRDNEMKLRCKIASGDYIRNNNITLNKYFEEWKELHDCKPNTLRSYISAFTKHISPALGNTAIQKIERREIQGMILKLSKSSSIHTANYSLLVTKMILREAVRDGIIAKNPAAEIKAFKDNNKDKAYDTIHRNLSPEEIRIFFEYAEGSMFKNFFRFQLYTGMRPGEVAALRISDIDRKKNCIHLQRTATYNAEGKLEEGSPKTYTSKRDIPLNADILKVIHEQIEQNQILFGKVLSMNALLFPGQNGQMIRNSALDRGIGRILKRAEDAGHHIDRFSAHCFRDTFATMWVEQGKPAHVLQKILGHKTLAITMDRYYHLPEQTKQAEMSSLIYAI